MVTLENITSRTIPLSAGETSVTHVGGGCISSTFLMKWPSGSRRPDCTAVLPASPPPLHPPPLDAWLSMLDIPKCANLIQAFQGAVGKPALHSISDEFSDALALCLCLLPRRQREAEKKSTCEVSAHGNYQKTPSGHRG